MPWSHGFFVCDGRVHKQTMNQARENSSMKKFKILIGMTAFAVFAFAGNRLAAFPLTLTSVSGTITYTAHYGASANTTTNPATKVAVNLSRLINVLSNSVVLDLGSAP